MVLPLPAEQYLLLGINVVFGLEGDGARADFIWGAPALELRKFALKLIDPLI